jgi:hypothetical protein
MTHRIVIVENGTGAGGTSTTTVDWTPSHDLSGNEQMRRVDKATRLAEKINDVLYGAESDQG